MRKEIYEQYDIVVNAIKNKPPAIFGSWAISTKSSHLSFQSVKICKPPSFDMTSGTGWSIKWYVFERIICVLANFNLEGSTDLTVALVPQKINEGVLILPCDVLINPSRAFDNIDFFFTWKKLVKFRWQKDLC